jgi:hypothetical protein
MSAHQPHKVNNTGHKISGRLQYNNSGDFNAPVSPIDRSSRQRNPKETSELNDTINQMDLTDTYRIFCPTLQNINSAIHVTFSKIDHILVHKVSVNK